MHHKQQKVGNIVVSYVWLRQGHLLAPIAFTVGKAPVSGSMLYWGKKISG